MNKNIKIIKLSPVSCLCYIRTIGLKGKFFEGYKFAQLAFIQDGNIYVGELLTNSFPLSNSGMTNQRSLLQEADRLVQFTKIQIDEEDLSIRIALIIKDQKQFLKCRLFSQIGRDPNKYLFDLQIEYINQKRKLVNQLKKQHIAQRAAEQQNLIKLKNQQLSNLNQKQKLIGKLSALYRTKRNKIREMSDKDPNFKQTYNQKIKEEAEIDHNFGASFFMQSQNFR